MSYVCGEKEQTYVGHKGLKSFTSQSKENILLSGDRRNLSDQDSKHMQTKHNFSKQNTTLRVRSLIPLGKQNSHRGFLVFYIRLFILEENRGNKTVTIFTFKMKINLLISNTKKPHQFSF